MSKRPANRRSTLIFAGVAAVAATAGPLAAHAAEVRGSVTFEGGAEIPKGVVEIYLEDTAVEDKAAGRSAATQLESSGGSKTLGFTLSLPEAPAASPTLQIVARLEREDGWLLARGSASFETGPPDEVVLNPVIY